MGRREHNLEVDVGNGENFRNYGHRAGVGRGDVYHFGGLVEGERFHDDVLESHETRRVHGEVAFVFGEDESEEVGEVDTICGIRADLVQGVCFGDICIAVIADLELTR